MNSNQILQGLYYLISILACAAPDGWPKPNVYWMRQAQNWLKTINSSRLTVDPHGKIWFSNVTLDDTSEDFLYACSAASYFRNEYKVGNRVHLNVIPRGMITYPPSRTIAYLYAALNGKSHAMT